MNQISLSIVLFFCFLSPSYAAIIYQNFEPDNGTPPAYGEAKDAKAEYGWGFNGAAVGLNDAQDPVNGGKHSWKVTIPAGEHVHAGSAVPAQVQTYMVDFVPQCHDRLTFWVWADPSTQGNHTVMIKFFDQGNYKQDGIGIWTQETAQYHQWTQLTILFSQFPSDFNLRRVDKIEFFNYWDGTYYYDDIEIHSANSLQADQECLKNEKYLSCLEDNQQQSGLRNLSGTRDTASFDKSRAMNPVLAAASDNGAFCYSVFSGESTAALDRSQMLAERRLEGLDLAKKYESR